MSASALYPTASKEALQEYVGKSIREVPLPAAVVNIAAVRRNCERMLTAVRELGLGWRAHVKTHKTVEGTRLQVGEGDVSQPVKIVVSTLAEAEHLLPMLLQWRTQGRDVNVLYGLPVARNAVPQLAELAKALGEGSVSVLLDDPAQIPAAARIHELSGIKAHAYMKLDMGGRRAGVIVGGGDGGDGARFLEVADAALRSHAQGKLVLAGLYSHAGHSYYGDSRVAALRMMRAEMDALVAGADKLRGRASGAGIALPQLVVSGGASPTTLSIQNLLGSRAGAKDGDETGTKDGDEAGTEDGDGVATALREEADALLLVLARAKTSGHAVEVHAGVYPFLDLQQLATHSIAASRLSWRDVALTLVAEVHGTYPGRGVGGTAEALVGAGSLALGREACKAYGGMAMLTPWGREGVREPEGEVEEFEGWGIGRFSQEHGIVTWMKGNQREKDDKEEKKETRKTEMDVLEVGQLVRLWPNHACIAGSHFGWYFVVDEDRQGSEDEIVDVWVRARGW